MAGLDLSQVHCILSGAERVHPATVKRFVERFAAFGLKERVVRPSLRSGEATLYVATPHASDTLRSARFDLGKLAAGVAQLRARAGGQYRTGHLPHPGRAPHPHRRPGDRYRTARGPHRGDLGPRRQRGGRLLAQTRADRPRLPRTDHPSVRGHPGGPWLRTGDLGAISDGELYIMGRLRDLLIVDGSNHYPDDIESTIREITGGRVAAIAVEDDVTENLVAIVEVKQRDDEDQSERLTTKHELARGDLEVAQPAGG